MLENRLMKIRATYVTKTENLYFFPILILYLNILYWYDYVIIKFKYNVVKYSVPVNGGRIGPENFPTTPINCEFSCLED